MSATIQLKMTADASPARAIVDELRSLLSAEEVGDVAKRLADFVERGGRIFHLNSVAAPGTRELVVRLEPTKAMLSLMAALRARNGDLVAVEDALCHLINPPAESVSQDAGGVESDGRPA